MDQSSRWVAAQNLARYRRQLAGETDPDKRQLLKRLLADEHGRLAGVRQDAGLSSPAK